MYNCRPNYLTGFLSLGTGTELVQAQDQLLKAWNSSAGISQLIADGATQAPVKVSYRCQGLPSNWYYSCTTLVQLLCVTSMLCQHSHTGRVFAQQSSP